MSNTTLRLALFVVLLLAGCGGGDPEDERATIDPPKCEQGACK